MLRTTVCWRHRGLSGSSGPWIRSKGRVKLARSTDPRHVRLFAAAWRFASPNDGAGPRGSGSRTRVGRRTGQDRKSPMAPRRPSAPPAPSGLRRQCSRHLSEEPPPRGGPMGLDHGCYRVGALDGGGGTPGASAPGSDSLWLGGSNATTDTPASTSGLTNTAKCGRWPPQPCTRYIGGPSPHSSPATRVPVPIRFYLPSRGHARWYSADLDSRTGGVHHNSTATATPEQVPPSSEQPNSSAHLGSDEEGTPEPATSRRGNLASL